MSSGHPIDSYDGLLPEPLEARMLGLLSRAGGIALLALVTVVWLSLATWSVNDPSLTHPTGQGAGNMAGPFGAVVSDLLLQMLGLAALVVLLAPMMWALDLIRHGHVAYFRLKAAWFPLSILAVAGFLSCLPVLSGWPLHHGHGGILGDLIANLARSLIFVLNPERASIVAGAVLGAAGLWLVLRSLGEDPRALATSATRAIAHRGATSSWHESLANEARRLAERIPVTGLTDPMRPNSAQTSRDWPAALGHGGTANVSTFEGQNAQHSGHLGGFDDPGVEDSGSARTLFARLRSAWTRDGREEHETDVRASEALADVTPALATARGDRSAASRSNLTAAAHEVEDASDFDIPAKFAARFDDLANLRPGSRDADTDEISEEDALAISSSSIAARFAPFAHTSKTARPPTGVESPQAARSPAGKVARDPTTQSKRVTVCPPLSILNRGPGDKARGGGVDPAAAAMANRLMSALGDYGVRGELRDISPGPVVTLYEFEPVRGTKAARIIALAEDIARSMSLTSVRAAVVPGRNVIGFELPNPRREGVYLRDLLESPSFRDTKAVLPLALGRGIGGEPIVTDLARMPHLLVAGTTGSGKSVGVNAMILSLLYRLPPEQCRFIMIDPKMLELSVYNGIPHLLTPVVTDPAKAVAALGWAVREMEERYKRMALLSVRNIEAFNARAHAAATEGEPIVRTVQTGFDAATGRPRYEQISIDAVPMPYIVIVVDEFADLMVVAGKEIEQAVQRLAQMARAAGIHLIMATQRPSVDIVTGTIKANFPSRISFKVASRIDSRTILNEPGAEQLLGQGDMLYSSGGGLLTRVHGAFVSDAEVEAVAAHLSAQGEPCYVAGVTEPDAKARAVGATPSSRSDRDNDLYERALEIVLQDRKASTSYLQRRLSIGYNKAADLIERMEREGYISPADAVGRREVLRTAA